MDNNSVNCFVSDCAYNECGERCNLLSISVGTCSGEHCAYCKSFKKKENGVL